MSTQEIRPDVFTADYTGKPGERSFFLQARTGPIVFTYSLEKQQVSLLVEKLGEILLSADPQDTIAAATPARDPALAVEPAPPQWRVGTIGLAHIASAGGVLVEVQEVEDEEEPEGTTGESVRFLLRMDQVRSFILHATAVVGEGRPLCQLCGLPMDPEGHACPASNGHHPPV